MASRLTIDLCAALRTPNIDARLVYLARRHIPVYCYSHLPRASTRAALRSLGLLDYFEDVLYAPAAIRGTYLGGPNPLTLDTIALLVSP